MFTDKVIAITGAGSGIGRSLAKQFAAAGARIAIADINPGALEETAQGLDPSRVLQCRVDVSSRAEAEGFAAAVQKHFGSVDYIINNAGTSILAPFEDLTIEEIEKVIAVNLWGVIYGTKAFMPIMLRQRSVCIVNVSSVFGLVATPCSAAYTMSKFAVRGLTETLWMELEGTGVRAVVVHPGGIDTNIKKTPNAQYESDYTKRVKEANARQMTTTPDDCAREIITGLRQGKPRLLVGNGAKQLHLLSRLFPNSYGGLIKKKLGL